MRDSEELDERGLPSTAETDVSKCDTAVNEVGRKTRQREEPVENNSTIVRQVDESQTAKQELQNDHYQRTALLVDIRE